jgi:uncharacterized RmlC-like cupin family protein
MMIDSPQTPTRKQTQAQAPAARVVKGGTPHPSAQGTVYADAISAETVGARALFFGMVTLPAGQRTRAHIHERHESAFYLLSGDHFELWSGPGLEHCSVANAGDYLFIPAGVPHVAVNRGRETAVLVGARNDPMANEGVTMTPELDARVR